MTLTIPQSSAIARKWAQDTPEIPSGVLLYPAPYTQLTGREFTVVLPIRFLSSDERKTFRVASILVHDVGTVQVLEERVQYVMGELLSTTQYEIIGRSKGPVRYSQDPYSANNPPPDSETALGRYSELLEKADRIELQLKTTTEAGFDSNAEFRQWHYKAIKALDHTRQEVRYLTSMIGELSREEGNANPLALQANSLTFDFATRVANKAERVRQKYSPVYSEEQQPSSVQEALDRKATLKELERECSLFLAEINVDARVEGVGKTALSGIKRPLSSIARDIQIETTLVNTYLRTSGFRPVQILLKIIDRIVAGGFDLTEQEHLDVAHILDLTRTD